METQRYLELKTEKVVMELLGCDRKTVKIACEEYGIDIVKSSEHRKKQVCMMDLDDNELKVFSSINEAGEYLGDTLKSKHIGKVCNGIRKTVYGYKWKYI